MPPKRKAPVVRTGAKQPTPTPKGNTALKTVEYVYLDATGNPLYRVIRKPLPDGDKTFRQDRYQNGDWLPGLTFDDKSTVERVLYNLPEVREAAQRRGVVWITEGEKDAESLIAKGLTATTSPMGAKNWKDEYAQSLDGVRYVTIVWDRDEEGRQYALNVERSLKALGIKVRFRRALEGKDVTDHLEAGHTISQLRPGRPGDPLPLSGTSDPSEGLTTPPTTSQGALNGQPEPAVYQLALLRLREWAQEHGRTLPRKTDTGWECCCPCPDHDDHNPSLGITVGDKHPVLVNCQAGCEWDDVAEALGIDPREFSRPRRNGPTMGRWEVLGVADARRIAQEPVDWVIPELLVGKEKVLIAGPPKQMKTWMSLHLSRCITLCEPVFGDELWTPGAAQPVLFVQEEGARQRWATRIDRTFADDPDDTPFRYVHRGGFDLSNPDCVKRLIDDALGVGARVVFLDPWQRITPGVKENDSTETGPAWDAVHRISEETGAATALLHHTRKDAGVTIDAIRGSIRMAGEVDLLIIMRKSSKGWLELNIDGRELDRPDFEEGNLKVMYGEPPHQMRHEGFVAGKKDQRTVREGVQAVLATGDGWLEAEEIRTKVMAIQDRDVTKQSVQNALNVLKEKEHIKSRPTKANPQRLEWRRGRGG